MAISYTPLEKAFTESVSGKAPSYDITSGSFFTSASFLYAFFFVIIVVAASSRYAYAGILRMQASQEGISKSKEEFKRVTYGLLGVFGLWLILFTVNKDLLTGDVGLGALKTKGGVSSPAPLADVAPSTQTGAGTVANSGSHTYTERVADHNRVLARLAPSGIHTNREDKPCTENQFKESKPACTSLAYLPEETIQLLLNINSSCRCSLVITGGTEPGHKTHGEGNRAVDLRISASQDASDPLYSYIKGVGSPWEGTSNCFVRYKWSSFTFCDEKPASNKHFHVN